MDPDPEPLLILSTLFSGTVLISVFVLFTLLICSALISGAEVAFFSLSPIDLEPQEDRKPSGRLRLITKLLQKPKKLLATILVANNTINIATVLLFASLGDVFFGDMQVIIWGFKLRFLIEVGIITFLILIFGEILPKIYASRNSLRFAGFMAVPLKVMDILFTPLSWPMQAVTVWIQARLGDRKSNFNVDHLSQALELASEEDTSTQEQQILQGIVSFGNTDTKQVMRPRMDVFALNQEDTYSAILPEILQNGYSRIPVYQESIDTIRGILYVKDLLPYLGKKELDWTSLLRTPYFVPENKKLDDLLSEFKAKKIHLAIVVDEYGGTSGVITMEDIIEEIVGDISDEFDDEDIIYSKLDDFNYVFEGKTSLKDFYRIVQPKDEVDFEDRKGEAETVAGFILEISGGFPRKNEVIKFKGHAFTIEAIDKKRIKQLKFTLSQ